WLDCGVQRGRLSVAIPTWDAVEVLWVDLVAGDPVEAIVRRAEADELVAEHPLAVPSQLCRRHVALLATHPLEDRPDLAAKPLDAAPLVLNVQHRVAVRHPF